MTKMTIDIMGLIDKVTKSTEEAQIIGDVETFIQDILNAFDARQLNLTYTFYKLFTTLIDEVTFKRYFNVLKIFYTSNLHLHQEAGLRFEPMTVFKLGVDNNLMDVVQWAFVRCHAFQEMIFGNVFQPWINACRLGYLEIAQFLLKELRKCFKVNIIERNALVGFEVACKYGRANIVEWLLSLEFKYEYNPDIVSTICDKHFINVLDILIQYRPYKLHIVFNADRTQVVSYAIHSLQEEKWLQRKLPLLAHYNNVTVFKDIPMEMVQHICQFV
jgi:hypothetical protein